MEKIAIAGAGLVGSLWAAMLAKRGYSVDVFERRSDMRTKGFIGGRSINLALSTRGWRALDIAGARERIEQMAIPMKGRMMHDREGNLTYQPYGKKDQAIYSVSRGGLNLELIALAEKHERVNFHFDQKCLGVDTRDLHIRFKDTNTGEVSKNRYDLIFGSDGAFSAVRNSLQRTPRFNYSQSYLKHGYKELSIPPAEDGTHKLDKNCLHIWPRRSFMLIALPNLDGSFTVTLFLPFEGEDSFENLKEDSDIEAFFKNYFADAVPLMPELLEDFHQNPTSPLVTVRCDPWLYKDRVLLIGDAAHAIVPFYGQGMNSGFEDCRILYDLLDEHAENWTTALHTFNDERIKDANAIADLAIRNFIEMRDLVADPEFLLRKKIAAYLHEKYPDFVPVYSMVSFSHIPYSEALAEADAQDALFERILSIPGIEDNWKSEKVDETFREWWKKKNEIEEIIS